jgi:hypothetical protein
MMKPSTFALVLVAAAAIGPSPAKAQLSRPVRMTVTYVTARQVYFDAGVDDGVSIGDTVTLTRSDTLVGQGVITAIASHSSVARITGQAIAPRIGDHGSISTGSQAPPPAVPVGVVPSAGTPFPPPVPANTQPPENILSGRVGVQYYGQWAEDAQLNIAQPSAFAYLQLQNVLGTGTALTFNAREYYDMSGTYMRYGDPIRSRFDMYLFRLERDRPDDWFGFSAGRIVSRYVSGLGTFDGGQILLRQGAFTSGVLIGKGIQGRALGLGGTETKAAAFVGFRTDDRGLWSYEATVAYARQAVHGNLDRSFMYVQGFSSFGSSLSMFGNAEVDLNDIQNGQRVSRLRLSNALFYVNYYPERWLSASLGYDGTRSVYLFETMKSIPDSLFKESLRNGFHARATIRPLPGISLTGSATFQTRATDPRNSHTLSGSVRFSDVFGTGFFAGASYASITGVYLNGFDIAYELERLLSGKIDLLLRYDIYAYSLTTISHAYRTQTVSAKLNWRVSRSLYTSAGGDYLIDDTMNSTRIFLELGVWF